MRKMIQRASALGLMFVLVVCGFAQTKIEMPKNNYPVEQDVAIRAKYEPEVRKKLKFVFDRDLQGLVERIGDRLVAAVPPEYSDHGFEYTFVVIDDRNINAFAMPAGFIAINRGMIEMCNNTDELAAVIAHEVSHVVLRHTTAKMTQASKFSWLQMAIIIGGSFGGKAGAVGASLGMDALGIYQLKYDRQAEKQSDILGAQILVRAGYAAYNMQNVMRGLQSIKGTSGAQWLRSHPNPEKRVEYIGQEAKMLKVTVTPAPTEYTLFKRLQTKLRERK